MRSWCSFAIGLSFALAGCDSSQSETCDSVSFPAPPSGAGEMLFVARQCNGDIADGTRERPFSLINDAIAKASPGATILVASETDYPENVVIDKSLSLLGAAPGARANEATVTIRSTTSAGIAVAPNVTGVVVRGFIVERAKGAGVWVQGHASAKIESLTVSSTEPDGDGNYGYGILVTEGGSADVASVDVRNARDVGVFVSGGSATMNNLFVSGIIQHGGIRAEDASGEVKLDNVNVEACTEVGVLIINSKATIKNTGVANVTEDDSGVGDGIIVRRRKNAAGDYVGNTQVDIDSATVTGVARVGILFSEGATGSLTNSNVVMNGVDPVWSAGVWLQSGAGGDTGVLISQNSIHDNKYNGIGMTSGAFARILNNTQISVNKADSFPPGVFSGEVLGQGIAVYGGARAQIEWNYVANNDLFGVLMDNPGAGTTLMNNEIQYNGSFGLVIQRAMNGIPPFAKNNLDGNGGGPAQVLGEAEKPFPVYDADLVTP